MALIFLTAFGAIICISEILTSKFKINKEVSRKFSHISSCLVAICFYPILNIWEVAIIALSAFSLLTILNKRKYITYLNSENRKTFGEYFLILGIFVAFVLAAFLKSLPAYIFSLTILAFADTAASLAGLVNISRKTNLGSVIFLAVYTVTALIFNVYVQDLNLILLISLGLLVTISERIATLGSDNLLIPIISYMSFYYCL